MGEHEQGAAPPRQGWFARLKAGLSKTQDALVGAVDRVLRGRPTLDAQTWEELEEALLAADLGSSTAVHLIEAAQATLSRTEVKDAGAVRAVLREQILGILQEVERPLDVTAASPFVIMVVGVNGSGKTTTIGKLARRLRTEGRSVLLAAADTFRAAAIEQLEIWGMRAGAEVIRQQAGSDPSAVAFDALRAARARGRDVVLVDTAGRLHTKVNLMEEMKKVRRILARELPGAPHEVLLVLDANTGQNAIAQARSFHEALGVTGLVLTKLDGTAKGGVVVGIAAELKIPLRFIGLGEGPEDLREFQAAEFVEALF